MSALGVIFAPQAVGCSGKAKDWGIELIGQQDVARLLRFELATGRSAGARKACLAVHPLLWRLEMLARCLRPNARSPFGLRATVGDGTGGAAPSPG